MASRAEQKAQLREERLKREQAQAAARTQRQRLLTIGGVVVAAVLIAVIAIVVSSNSGSKGSGKAAAATQPKSAQTKATDQRVGALLSGIPQPADNVLGKPNAPLTIIEYGDLECSVCDQFALPGTIYASDGQPGSGVEDQIINNLVRTGKAKFEYESLQTATPSTSTFIQQQVAAYAAGLQGKGWNYVELFYNEQGQEGSGYVTSSYLDGIAKQIPGLNYSRWQKDLTLSSLVNQVKAEIASGTKADNGQASTPTVLVKGAKGETIVAQGIPTYAQVQSALKAVG
ncbi:MAG TPA: thioredoxin domain-containing protein [Solirubrobacteraceae bacterium]|nr:thioredoxin domain-containing protein [Solirubrobacteraceae bacterium]